MAAKAKLGPDHPKTIAFMHNLAAIYLSAKQLDKSIPLSEDVLKRREAKLGRQHPNTQSTVALLGRTYKEAGRLTEAIPLLEEAYNASRKLLNLRWIVPQLLDAYMKAGKPAEAKKVIQEELTNARKTLPNESPQLAVSLAQCGMVYLHLKAYDDAEPILREALTIREKKDPEAWITFYSQLMLGGALFGQKKYADAEPLLLKGYAGMKQREEKIPPQAKIRLVQAADQLIELYTVTQKPDEVKKWQEVKAKVAKPAPRPDEKK
jgi:tetratricopeptide (TPR) repeat protein